MQLDFALQSEHFKDQVKKDIHKIVVLWLNGGIKLWGENFQPRRVSISSCIEERFGGKQSDSGYWIKISDLWYPDLNELVDLNIE